ncbi:LysR family transcriptional regulator [Aquabacterium sp. J223]|uniref:LysR family transcriptional regulator n=1 Tax=Aquabacterium sp. J223 TaxID=2898431 RepID=UPI0021ADC04A|nr:LysR family transcriptional regulator [Aquabacterium sp. J223]UUX97142.1 LysR family transcriptional regulator [Aquabacterium sp. J223]
MNLRFVEAYYWAVSLNSVTRAAEKLHITQSALSSRIAGLEAELGAALLDRRSRQFRVTAAGLRFHAFAQQLLTLQRQIKSEMGGDAPAAPVQLRIGAIESVVHSWLTGWLQQMRRSHPDFQLDLTVEMTPVLTDQVARGSLDLVFAALPAGGAGMRVRPLPDMEMSFVGHRALHTRRRYTLDELAGFDLMTFQRGSQPHVALLELFRRAGTALPRVHSISSISAMSQLVEGGFGIATLPRAAAERLARHLPLKTLRCDTGLTPLTIYASFRDDPGSVVVQSVLDAAVAYVGTDRKPSKK